MKAPFTISILCLLLMAGCLEFKSSVFDTETGLSHDWNSKFSIPTYNLAGGDIVRFALFTDSHHNYQDLDDTIQYINNSGAQFAINLGDFTDVGTRDEYEIFHAFLRDLTIPSWIVPGNHDLATTQDKLFSRVFGAQNHSIVTSFGKFIFWNSNALELRPASANINWLDNEVSTASATEPVFIFQHQDPFNSLTFSAAEQTQLTNVFLAHPQIFLFHGHLHSFNRTQSGNAEAFQISRVEGVKWAQVEIDNVNVRVFYCTKQTCDKVYESASISPVSINPER